MSRAHRIKSKLTLTLQVLGEDESACPEWVNLSEVISSSLIPKAELQDAMEGKRVKNELKAFKWTVSDKLELGDTASWIELVTAEELASLCGRSNRLFQLLVEGKEANSLMVDTDTLRAAAGREDFFTPKQCEKLMAIREEAEARFTAEAEGVIKEEEEQKRQASIQKDSEERARQMPWGATVAVVGLRNQPALNGLIGTISG